MVLVSSQRIGLLLLCVHVFVGSSVARNVAKVRSYQDEKLEPGKGGFGAGPIVKARGVAVGFGKGGGLGGGHGGGFGKGGGIGLRYQDEKLEPGKGGFGAGPIVKARGVAVGFGKGGGLGCGHGGGFGKGGGIGRGIGKGGGLGGGIGKGGGLGGGAGGGLGGGGIGHH